MVVCQRCQGKQEDPETIYCNACWVVKRKVFQVEIIDGVVQPLKEQPGLTIVEYKPMKLE